MGKECKWCKKNITSKRKDYCNIICGSNYFEMINIDIPTIWFRKIKFLSNEQKDIEIEKLSSLQKLKPNFVKRKIEELIKSENNENKI